jgi:hypothetical protein
LAPPEFWQLVARRTGPDTVVIELSRNGGRLGRALAVHGSTAAADVSVAIVLRMR